MEIDSDGPAIYIYDNPRFVNTEELDFYETIETPEGKQELIKRIKDKNNDLNTGVFANFELIDELEVSILSLVDDYSSDYLENQVLLKDTIKKSSNIETKRKCLMYLLGGGTLGYHFFNKDGSFKSMLEIDEEINKLLSWKGMTFQDYFTLNKVWKEMSFKLWLLLKIMSRSKFVLDYLHHWFKNTFVKNLSLAAASLFFISYGGNTFENIMISISVLVIGFLSIHLYEGAYTVEEVNIINNNVEYIQESNTGVTEETKQRILLFKEEYSDLDQEIKNMRQLSDKDLEKEIHTHIQSKIIFKIKRKNKRLIEFLINILKSVTSIGEMYVEIRKLGILVPLAIYFFDKNGSARTVRDSICSIIIVSKHFIEEEYTHLKNPEVVPSYRKKNLVGMGYLDKQKKSSPKAKSHKKKKKSVIRQKKI